MTDEEKRPNRMTSPRHRVLKGGRIIFREGFSVVDCLVRDESVGGGRLRVASVIGIPDTFRLQIMRAEPCECHVVWRTAEELGVEFIRAKAG